MTVLSQQTPGPAGEDGSSAEIERAVLACALRSPGELIPELRRQLEIDDFSKGARRHIYAALCELAEEESPIETLTVRERLSIADRAELYRLEEDLPALSAFSTYVHLLHQATQKRRLGLLAESLTAAAYGAGDADSVIARTLRQLEELQERRSGKLGSNSDQSISAMEFLSLDIPPRRWLAAALLQEKDACMVHAARGVGKSQFVMGLAAALACGRDFLRHTIPAPVGVLIVDGEMPEEDLQDRLRMHLAGHSPLTDLRLLARQREGFRNLDADPSPLYRALESNPGIEVVILDTAGSLFSPEVALANDPESWGPAQALLLDLRSKGYATVLTHHDGKSGSQRGTSTKEDILSQVLQLRRPTGCEASVGCKFTVEYRKARAVFGEDAEPYDAELSVEDLGGFEWLVADKAMEVRSEHRTLVHDAIEAKPGIGVRDLHAALTGTMPRDKIDERLRELTHEKRVRVEIEGRKHCHYIEKVRS